jgi:hypothetical protein
MRVAPLGSFFADQRLEVVCNQARPSAEATMHMQKELPGQLRWRSHGNDAENKKPARRRRRGPG